MGLYIVIVLGMAGCTGIVGYTILHYFSKAMNTRDAILVDPKPSN